MVVVCVECTVYLAHALEGAVHELGPSVIAW